MGAHRKAFEWMLKVMDLKELPKVKSFKLTSLFLNF